MLHESLYEHSFYTSLFDKTKIEGTESEKVGGKLVETTQRKLPRKLPRKSLH